ncbi:MAG: hypothetical protein M3336_16890, partial [Chloroflexota bacterium]|nr:hypothetical protein [Chloroflexota bacterium]
MLEGNLDVACEELWRARDLEPDLDHLGALARELIPADWELETDLTPLARALSTRSHPRAADTWRRVLDDRPARSVQAEAAEWLARDAMAAGHLRAGLRMLHASTSAGRRVDPETIVAAYRAAGLDPAVAFAVYLAVSRMDAHTARASDLRDPLTDGCWADQDPRWWLLPGAHLKSPRRTWREQTDHQLEALNRARDLAETRRETGW